MNGSTENEYLLGYSEPEMDRLALQATVMRPITERLLREASLSEGMGVLDLGIDKSADAVARASERASELGSGVATPINTSLTK
jgi:hypothetical protein